MAAEHPIPSWLTLDPRERRPVYRQIYERIKAAILDGRMAPGARLPSWSGLAGTLGVARGTVKAAYDWLAGEGYLVGQGAAGSFVNPELARPELARPELARPMAGRRGAAPRAAPRPAAGLATAAPRPLQMGVPALDVFPRALWSRLLARQLRRPALATLAYQDPAGQPALRQAIADYLAIARGIACDPAQVFITAGYAGALDLITRGLMKPGDALWFEDPGYYRAREGLKLAGARIVPVPVDGEGLVVAEGLARRRDARFAVVTPSHQAPLGMALSLPRRLALLDWAARSRTWIVEDDYYGEFRLQGPPLASLKSLDAAGRVLYVGSFSKVLLPGLRLGYVVVPAAEVEGFARIAGFLSPSQALFSQLAVADFMIEGHFARHIRRMRRIYAERRAALVAALQTAFGDRLEIGLRDSGMHLIAYLPAGSDDRALARRAEAAGLAPAPLSPWAIEAKIRPGLLMSFANVAPAAAPRLARRLQRALESPRR